MEKRPVRAPLQCNCNVKVGHGTSLQSKNRLRFLDADGFYNYNLIFHVLAEEARRRLGQLQLHIPGPGAVGGGGK